MIIDSSTESYISSSYIIKQVDSQVPIGNSIKHRNISLFEGALNLRQAQAQQVIVFPLESSTRR